MRKHTILTALALTFSLIIGIQLVTTQVRANVIPVCVNIDPDVLLLKNGGVGKWTTAYIELPNGYDVNNIDMSSVTLKVLGNNVSASMCEIQGKRLMAKFDRADVIRFLWPMIDHMSPRAKQDVTLTVTGKYNGDVFEGSDTIKVIYTHLESSASLDVYTQKPNPYSGKGLNMPSDAFGPQEEVILYAYVSYNCDPLQNKLVVFEVKNPDREPIIYRTATTNAEGIATSSFRISWGAADAESLFGEWTIYGSVEIAETIVNDTCTFKFGWLIEITQVETVDAYGNAKTSFTKGEHIHFNMSIKNIAFTSKIATFTLVVYDECDVPIAQVILHDSSLSSGTTEIFIIDLQIPKWTYVGVGTVYANAYTDLPQLYGTPYCPEMSTTFMITKS